MENTNAEITYMRHHAMDRLITLSNIVADLMTDLRKEKMDYADLSILETNLDIAMSLFNARKENK